MWGINLVSKDSFSGLYWRRCSKSMFWKYAILSPVDLVRSEVDVVLLAGVIVLPDSMPMI